ncbi:hypothetical protein D1007_45238 [Hordeum vulgare]|nr:hypothetical protein D1007_45238 [Hordeum vulgare]
MVFEDESSDDESTLPYMHSSNSSIDWIYQVPASVEDPNYHGLELDIMVLCDKHGKASMRNVAFEGTNTGRRFLACVEPEGDSCGFVEWVDQEWPITMQNALLKLWAMFEDTKNGRVTDNLESALIIHHLTEEKNILDANCDNHMKEKQVHSEAMEKLELKNAELTKSEEKLTQEKLELKFQIVDLLKGNEVHSEDRGQLELQIAELMKGEEDLKLKLKCILAILQK